MHPWAASHVETQEGPRGYTENETSFDYITWNYMWTKFKNVTEQNKLEKKLTKKT